jgi:iron complex outermembrane receptor protein
MILKRLPSLGRLLLAVSWGGALLAYLNAGIAPAWADSDADSDSVVQEVVVTAQKREQSAQSVGISMSTFRASDLKSFGLTQSVDIAKLTPGVSVAGSYAGLMSQYSIRGLTQNDFVDHTEAPVAVYIDEGYVAMQQGQSFSLFDIDRVEAMKGPQGTLFGRNSTGGLIHFISKRPTDTLEGYADVTYGSYNQARFEGALSGPLTTNVSGRISVMYDYYEPVLHNDYPQTFVPSGLDPPLNNGAAPPGRVGGLMDDKTWATRGQLLFRLGEKSELLLIGFGSRTRTSTGPYQSVPTIAVVDAQGRQINTLFPAAGETREMIGPGGMNVTSPYDTAANGLRPVAGADFFGYRDPDGSGLNHSSCDYCFSWISDLQTVGASAKYSTQFNGVTFTSVTDYKNYYKFIPLDLEAGPASQYNWLSQADEHTISQELRLNGPSAAATRWVTGVFLLHITNWNVSGLTASANSNTGFVFNQPRIARLNTDSYALFGQVEHDLSDTLTLTAGARGTTERKKYFYEVLFTPNVNPMAWNFANPIDVPGFVHAPYTARTEEPLWTGKLQLDWKPVHGMLVYGSVNRGAKAGNFNAAGPTIEDSAIPYKKETLYAYELGFKSMLFDNTVRLNGAVYYNDDRDYQASFWTGLSNIITNNNAKIKGAELEIAAQPIRSLNTLFTFGVNDATVEGVIVAGAPRDVRPTFDPKVSASAMLRYDLPWRLFAGPIALQTAATYQSSIYQNLANFDADRYGGYTLVNLRATWKSAAEDWQADVFVNNVTNKIYDTVGFDLAQLCGCNEHAQGKPRWFGASLRYSF